MNRIVWAVLLFALQSDSTGAVEYVARSPLDCATWSHFIGRVDGNAVAPSKVIYSCDGKNPSAVLLYRQGSDRPQFVGLVKDAKEASRLKQLYPEQKILSYSDPEGKEYVRDARKLIYEGKKFRH